MSEYIVDRFVKAYADHENACAMQRETAAELEQIIAELRVLEDATRAPISPPPAVLPVVAPNVVVSLQVAAPRSTAPKAASAPAIGVATIPCPWCGKPMSLKNACGKPRSACSAACAGKLFNPRWAKNRTLATSDTRAAPVLAARPPKVATPTAAPVEDTKDAFHCVARRIVISPEACMKSFVDANAFEDKASKCFKCVAGERRRREFAGRRSDA